MNSVSFETLRNILGSRTGLQFTLLWKMLRSYISSDTPELTILVESKIFWYRPNLELEVDLKIEKYYVEFSKENLFCQGIVHTLDLKGMLMSVQVMQISFNLFLIALNMRRSGFSKASVSRFIRLSEFVHTYTRKIIFPYSRIVKFLLISYNYFSPP